MKKFKLMKIHNETLKWDKGIEQVWCCGGKALSSYFITKPMEV